MPRPHPSEYAHTRTHARAHNPQPILGKHFQIAHKETSKVFHSYAFHDVREILANTSNAWLLGLLCRMRLNLFR